MYNAQSLPFTKMNYGLGLGLGLGLRLQYYCRVRVRVSPPVPVWTEGLINITGNVLPVQAMLEKMPLPLWLSLSSKFTIVRQTKQRLKVPLFYSLDCKSLERLECVEIWLVVCCRLMLWDFTWEVCITTEHCVQSFDNNVMCDWHQGVKKECQSPIQIRKCGLEKCVQQLNIVCSVLRTRWCVIDIRV